MFKEVLILVVLPISSVYFFASCRTIWYLCRVMNRLCIVPIKITTFNIRESDNVLALPTQLISFVDSNLQLIDIKVGLTVDHHGLQNYGSCIAQ